jgi:L-rhamnose isomerase/sugar isomerase
MAASLAFKAFEERQKERGIALRTVFAGLDDLKVELPSWGFGDSGTRFKVFQKTGVPRNVFEKFDDAALVNKLTGFCPSVAVHIPWDKLDDYGKLKKHAATLGLKVGAVNPNLFQDDDYMLGSVCHPSARVRRKALAHLKECTAIMKASGSDILSLWFSDGTNYPGQDDMRRRKQYMGEALLHARDTLPAGSRMLLEYKNFEPAFYHTDVVDWGYSLLQCMKLGPKAQVLVDTGHHAPGTNVEQIVANLLDEQKLGGFHFNCRNYADDDLIVGSTNAYQIFLIFYNILAARFGRTNGPTKHCAEEIAYMVDQSHVIEPKIPAMIRSALNIQTNWAKALLINWKRLAAAQDQGDVMGAEAEVREAFEQDVRPLLHAWRESKRLPVEPMDAFHKSGYTKKVASRGKGGASW